MTETHIYSCCCCCCFSVVGGRANSCALSFSVHDNNDDDASTCCRNSTMINNNAFVCLSVVQQTHTHKTRRLLLCFSLSASRLLLFRSHFQLGHNIRLDGRTPSQTTCPMYTGAYAAAAAAAAAAVYYCPLINYLQVLI